MNFAESKPKPERYFKRFDALIKTQNTVTQFVRDTRGTSLVAFFSDYEIQLDVAFFFGHFVGCRQRHWQKILGVEGVNHDDFTGSHI